MRLTKAAYRTPCRESSKSWLDPTRTLYQYGCVRLIPRMIAILSRSSASTSPSSPRQKCKICLAPWASLNASARIGGEASSAAVPNTVADHFALFQRVSRISETVWVLLCLTLLRSNRSSGGLALDWVRSAARGTCASHASVLAFGYSRASGSDQLETRLLGSRPSTFATVIKLPAKLTDRSSASSSRNSLSRTWWKSCVTTILAKMLVRRSVNLSLTSVCTSVDRMWGSNPAQVMLTWGLPVSSRNSNSDFAKQPFEFELRDDTGRPHVNITCAGFDPHILSTEVQTDVRERLTDLLTNIFARIVVTHDFHQVLERLFRDELALDRSVNFAGSFITVANVLGREPKSRVSSWSDPEAREYPNARTEAWDAHVPRAAERTQSNAKPLTPGKDNPPDDLFDRSNVRQSEIQTVSLIRETLWNKAKWSATVFGTAADEASPPILALAFKDAQGAKQIFHFWRGELGEVDAEERLRIAIIRGISRTHPYWYKVLVGSNHDLELSRQGVRYAAFVSRINKMQPDSGDNLERFLRSYERFKGYFLMPGALRAAEPEILYGSALFKRELHVRQAWEIGRNDPDGVAIHPDDGPLIPDGQENAPVLALLKWKQERSKA